MMMLIHLFSQAGRLRRPNLNLAEKKVFAVAGTGYLGRCMHLMQTNSQKISCC